MIDGRNRPYDDESDHQRRRHPAVDRGHQVLRDTQGGAAGYDQAGYGAAYPSPYGDDGDYAPGFIEQGFDPVEEPRQRRDASTRRPRPTSGADPYAAPAYPQQPDYQTDPRVPRTDTSRLAAGRRDARAARDPRGNTDPRGNVYGDAGYDTRGQAAGGYNAAYDNTGYDAPGYGGAGYENPGYDNQGYDSPGRDSAGYANGGYANAGYDQAGYDQPGYDQAGYDQAGYDNSGYDRAGYQSGYDSYDDLADPVGAEKPRRRGRSTMALVLVFAMLAAVGGVGFVGYRFYVNHFTTPDYSGNGTGSVAVTVNNGDTATIIADTLYKDGVVKSSKAFIAAAVANPNSKNIEVGTYALHKQMSAVNALAMLLAVNASGRPLNLMTNTVTIPEGALSFDIFAKLSAATHIPVKDFQAAAKDPVALGVNPAWFSAKRNDGRASKTSIEGFLFPATYPFQPGETAKQMLTAMVAKFNSVVGPSGLNFMATAAGLHATPYEALIAASIAQKEATTPADMAGVTEVLYNRVFKSFPCNCLGVDSAVNYYLRSIGKSSEESQNLTNSELHNLNDPYNTRDKPGFTPGAISNPGRDALNAAIHPDASKSSYFYFQTVGTNPKVVFAKTYNQFLAQGK